MPAGKYYVSVLSTDLALVLYFAGAGQTEFDGVLIHGDLSTEAASPVATVSQKGAVLAVPLEMLRCN